MAEITRNQIADLMLGKTRTRTVKTYELDKDKEIEDGWTVDGMYVADDGVLVIMCSPPREDDYSTSAELRSVEIWDGDELGDWEVYDCPLGETVLEYSNWCVGAYSCMWATVNGPEDKIRLNGWLVLDGAKLFPEV
jgi:hypothetical protein